MSKTQDKRLQRKVEHAEFLWEQAQMKAAMMQQMLDIAIAEVETHEEELKKTEVWAEVQKQMTERQKDIENYLMKEKDKYLERINGTTATQLSDEQKEG